MADRTAGSSPGPHWATSRPPTPWTWEPSHPWQWTLTRAWGGLLPRLGASGPWEMLRSKSLVGNEVPSLQAGFCRQGSPWSSIKSSLKRSHSSHWLLGQGLPSAGLHTIPPHHLWEVVAKGSDHGEHGAGLRWAEQDPQSELNHPCHPGGTSWPPCSPVNASLSEHLSENPARCSFSP